MERSREELFTYDKEKLLGKVRFDFNDGGIATSWHPQELLKSYYSTGQWILIQAEINKELNPILAELSYDKMVYYCSGSGYNKQELEYIVGDVCNYIIQYRPVRDDYSYIFVCAK